MFKEAQLQCVLFEIMFNLSTSIFFAYVFFFMFKACEGKCVEFIL